MAAKRKGSKKQGPSKEAVQPVVQPAAATVISHVPLYGIPASFVKTKVRYLTIQYDDPDSKAAGITSFKLENKETLDSVLYAVATKAGLTQRGEIYVRKKESN